MSRSLFFPGRGRSLPQSTVGVGPVGELRRFLGSWLTDLRRGREYRNVLDGEAALDIAADIVERDAAAGRQAHAAEVHDLEAARLMQAAQHPASPGGRNITPAEAAPILRLVHRSAATDHAIAEQLT